jgi:two-component system CheB/CheR fusion protein
MFKRLLIIFSLLIFTLHLSAKERVNVGIYQNAPKIFMNEQNAASGYFIDILNEIALQEEWDLHYVPCLWSECLNMLETGQIDIMPDVAHIPQREKRFLFSKEAVISSWSVLYKHKDSDIDSLFSLQDKTIAVLKESTQASSIQTLLHSFNIHPRSYVEVSNFSEAFELLAEKKVDSVLTNRFYELSHKLAANIVKTNIVIEPGILKYAFSPARSDLANAVDAHLKEFKKDAQSILYKAEEKWMMPKDTNNIPSWLQWTLGLSVLVILILTLLVFTFRKMVTIKSQELLQKEDLMIIQSRHAAMGEMIGMIAHQWRQPLSVISMSVNNIKLSLDLDEEIKEETLREHLKTVSDSVQHLSTTIDDFRNFFKPNKAKATIQISHLINEVNKILHINFKNNDIAFIVQNDDDYEIETFANELLQVILNLVNNAKDILKEQKTKNPRIVLTTSQTNESYTLSVCDNGGGIPTNILHKIGKQYFTTKSDNGTGLGLYMSLVIVEQHLNGSLTWENREDGACFTVSIFK